MDPKLSTLLFITILQTTQAIRCGVCHHVANIQHCHKTEECPSGVTECFVEIQDHRTHKLYTAGCGRAAGCSARETPHGVIGLLGARRPSNHLRCTVCCDTENCNIQNPECDPDPFLATSNTCLSCSTDTFSECVATEPCRGTQKCTLAVTEDKGKRRYTASCREEWACDATNQLLDPPRHQGNVICAQCCNGHNCNQNLCQAFVVTDPSKKTTPTTIPTTSTTITTLPTTTTKATTVTIQTTTAKPIVTPPPVTFPTPPRHVSQGIPPITFATPSSHVSQGIPAVTFATPSGHVSQGTPPPNTWFPTPPLIAITTYPMPTRRPHTTYATPTNPVHHTPKTK